MFYEVWRLQLRLYCTSIIMQIPLCDCLSFNSWNKWQDDSDFYCLYQFPRLGLCHSRFSLPVIISSGVLLKKGITNFILFVIFRLQVNFTPNTFLGVEFTLNTCRLFIPPMGKSCFQPLFSPSFLNKGQSPSCWNCKLAYFFMHDLSTRQKSHWTSGWRIKSLHV